jgi:hypothetical protein
VSSGSSSALQTRSSPTSGRGYRRRAGHRLPPMSRGGRVPTSPTSATSSATGRTGFDRRAQERRLNEFAHRSVRIDGVMIHAVLERARDGHGVPLILSHGWPSTFLEYLPLVPLLTNPAAHCIDGPSFDLVIPSLPACAFSERPDRAGVNYREVAVMCTSWWARSAMHATGRGDFGAGVVTFRDPARHRWRPSPRSDSHPGPRTGRCSRLHSRFRRCRRGGDRGW